jgi:hypothetical protein
MNLSAYLKIIYFCACLSTMPFASIAQGGAIAHLVGYIVERGTITSVRYSSAQQLKLATNSAGKVLPVYLFDKTLNNTKDGIYIDKNSVPYFYLDINNIFDISDSKTKSLLDMQLEAEKNYKKLFEKRQYLGYDFIKTGYQKVFFIGLMSHGIDRDRVQIKKAQKVLQRLGYYSCSDKCKIDGVIGPRTIEAYTNFVTDYGLEKAHLLILGYEPSTTISFLYAVDFYDYYQSKTKVERLDYQSCPINELCLSNSSISLSIQCRPNVSSGVEFDFWDFKIASLSYSSYGAKKSISFEKNSDKLSVPECDFGAGLCVGLDDYPTGNVVICGANVSRDGIESVSFTDPRGVTYTLDLKSHQ